VILGSRTVVAPDGTEWRVSVDWHRAHVRLPTAWRRRKRARKRSSDSAADWLEACDCISFGDDLVSGFVVVFLSVVVGALLWLLVWPVLALAAEVLIRGAGGACGRARPRGIRASLDDRGRVGRQALRWTVRGLGGADRCIGEIADALAAGLRPAPLGAEAITAGH